MIPLFSKLHILNRWWKKPSKFSLFTLISVFSAIVVSSFFPRTGSIVFLFLLTLVFIPFIFHVAENVKKVSDIKKWWKHFLLFMFIIGFAFSLYIFVSPIESLDSRFETQWEESQERDVDVKPFPSVDVFNKVLINNSKVILKIIVLSLLFGTGGLFLSLYTLSSFSLLTSTFLISKKHLIISSKGSLLSFFGFMYLPHLILEIISYLIAGVASIIVVNQTLSSKNKLKAFKSSLNLFLKMILLSIAIMIVAAIFESFIDPWLASLFFKEEFAFRVPLDPYNLLY